MSLIYLRATRPNGNVHASLCETGLGYAAEFRRVMEVQGLTVTEYSKAEYWALFGPGARALGPRLPTSATHQLAPEQSHDAPPTEEAALVSPTPNPITMPDLFGNWSPS